MPTYIPYTSNVLKIAPTAQTATAITPSGSAWVSGAYVTIIASTSAALVLAGIVLKTNGFGGTDFEIDIATGAAASEVVIATFSGRGSSGGTPVLRTFMNIPYLIDNIGSGVRVSARIRCSSTSTSAMGVKVAYYEKPIVGNLPTTAQPLKSYPAAANSPQYTAGASWADGAYVEIVSSTATALILAGAAIEHRSNNTQYEVDIATGGAGSEVILTTFRDKGSNGAEPFWLPLTVPIAVAASTRLSCRCRTSIASTPAGTVKLGYFETPL